MNYKPQPNFITLPLFGKKPLSGDPLTITDKNAYHFVIGSVLGDGYISKSNFNLEMEQKSVTYAFWKRTLAKEYVLIGVNSTKLYEISFMGKKAYLPLTMKKHHVKPTVDRLIQDHPQVFTSVGVEKKVRLEQP